MYTSLSQIDNVLEYFSKLSGIVSEIQPAVETHDEPCKSSEASDMPDIEPHQYRFIDWKYVSSLKLAPEQYIKYAEHLAWDIASRHVPEDVAVAYKHCVNWSVYVEFHPDVNVARLIDAQVTIPWKSVCMHVNLGEDNVVKYLPIMEEECPDIWHYLSRFQKLSETLIEDNVSKFDWIDGPYFQNLSPTFLEKYIDLIDVAEFHDYGLLPL